jgi:tetratricopeptide (TPR) repeat protein
MVRERRTQADAEGRRGSRGRLAACPAILVLTALVACAPSAAQKAEADMASVRKESDAKTLLERGKAFAAVGDHTRAEEYLASSIEAGADPREALPALMDVCVKTGRYRSAIQHGENHLRKHPGDAGTRLMVGSLYAAIGEAVDARMHVERVIAALTEGRGERRAAAVLAQAHYLLAVLARDTEHDPVAADRHFREYLRLDPSGAHVEEANASLFKRVPSAIALPDGGAP